MEKLDLTVLMKTLRKSLKNVIPIKDYDYELDEQCLYLECLSGVTDNYKEFAIIYEDGRIDMRFGAINILDEMEDIEQYYDPETGGVLPEFDNYDTVVEIIKKCVAEDLEYERSFLEDIAYAIEGE